MRIWMRSAEQLVGDGERDASRANFLRELIEAATSRAAGPSWRSAVRCIEPMGRRRCRGWMSISREEPSVIVCSCEACFQVGTLAGFEGTEMDLSRYVPRGRTVGWGLDEESRTVLRGATEAQPALRAVVSRASPHSEVRKLLVVAATVRELDAMYSRVEELLDVARGERRRELLTELLASLSTSIDGF
jgi:hypothetical protein